MKYILKREMLVCYEKVLIEEEKSQATIEKYMRDVRKFFQYVEEMGKKEGITKEIVLYEYCKQEKITSGMIFISRRGNPVDRSNILHEMKNLCGTAGVEREKVFPHNLRHLFAYTYYKAEKDIAHLADILGHSSINTTRIYTMGSGEEEMKQLSNLGLIVRCG